MTQVTITETDLGQTVVATDGILNDVIVAAVPNASGYGQHLTLVRNLSGVDRTILNLDISNTYISVNGHISSGMGAGFNNLTVESIPAGSSFILDYGPAPVLTSLNPATAVSGDVDFTLQCIGTDFTENTVINFAGYDEPTTFVSATEVTTIVKPSLFAPGIVPVYLHIGPYQTTALDFTFT